MHVDIFLTEHATLVANAFNEPPALTQALKQLRRFMELLFPDQVPEILSKAELSGTPMVRPPFDPTDLYRCLEEYKAAKMVTGRQRSSPQYDELSVELRPYQVRRRLPRSG